MPNTVHANDVQGRLSALEKRLSSGTQTNGEHWFTSPNFIWGVIVAVVLALMGLVYRQEDSKIDDLKTRIGTLDDPNTGSIARLEKEITDENSKISYLTGLMSSLTGQTLHTKAESLSTEPSKIPEIGNIVQASLKGGVSIPATDVKFATDQLLNARYKYSNDIAYWKTVGSFADYRSTKKEQSHPTLPEYSNLPSCLAQVPTTMPIEIAADGTRRAGPIRMTNCRLRLEETAKLPTGVLLEDIPGSPDGKPIESTVKVGYPTYIFDHAYIIYSTGMLRAGNYQFIDCIFDWNIQNRPSPTAEQLLTAFLESDLSQLEVSTKA